MSTALAEEHVVIILGSAYFPQSTAVEEGDTVRFVNASGHSHTVMHADGAWATPAIADGQELRVQIESGMTGAFYGRAGQQIVGQLETLRDPPADREVR